MSSVINIDKPDDKKIGIIYLLKMCDTNNKCIYKVGRTINFENRLKNYNYCDILTLIRSNNINIIRIATKDNQSFLIWFKMKLHNIGFFTFLNDRKGIKHSNK